MEFTSYRSNLGFLHGTIGDVLVVQCVFIFKKIQRWRTAVKFRGIFLNDEAPALTKWAAITFGGFNSRFYEKAFEINLAPEG